MPVLPPPADAHAYVIDGRSQVLRRRRLQNDRSHSADETGRKSKSSVKAKILAKSVLTSSRDVKPKTIPNLFWHLQHADILTQARTSSLLCSSQIFQQINNKICNV